MSRAHGPTAAARAVFLDRDGTINCDTGYTHRVEDLRILPHVPEALRMLADMGFLLIVATNQAGIARGYFTEEQMEAFNAAVMGELESHGVRLTRIYHCPFHPNGTIERFRHDSPDRKPGTGMLDRAAADFGIDLAHSYMIGDRASDIEAGRRAGCTTILLSTSAPDAAVQPDWIAGDLREAARFIQRRERGEVGAFGPNISP